MQLLVLGILTITELLGMLAVVDDQQLAHPTQSLVLMTMSIPSTSDYTRSVHCCTDDCTGCSLYRSLTTVSILSNSAMVNIPVLAIVLGVLTINHLSRRAFSTLIITQPGP